MTQQDQSENEALVTLQPDIDSGNWPKIKLKSLELFNFGKHKDVKIDFSPKNISLNCIVGPNGIGKTTILNSIQLLFANFNGYEKERLKALTLKNIRNYMDLKPDEIANANFSITGNFQTDKGDEYSVVIKRDGVAVGHPGEIQENLQYYCYFASFDRELHLFQLKRDRWPKFKELMEAVTGFTIEEDIQTFGLDSDPKFKRIMKDYVISFKMDKGREIIGHRQCSAGERKIIRTFSALLNRPVTPSIILIDNVTDHVESSRHINVINALEKTFNESQIIVTCHSAPIQKYLPNSSRLLDMRLLDSSEDCPRSIHTLRLIDELEDMILRINAFVPSNNQEEFLAEKWKTDANLLVSMVKSGMYLSDEVKELACNIFRLTIGAKDKNELIRIHGG